MIAPRIRPCQRTFTCNRFYYLFDGLCAGFVLHKFSQIVFIYFASSGFCCRTRLHVQLISKRTRVRLRRNRRSIAALQTVTQNCILYFFFVEKRAKQTMLLLVHLLCRHCNYDVYFLHQFGQYAQSFFHFCIGFNGANVFFDGNDF